MSILGDKSKAITAEDLIRRYGLDKLVGDRKAITTLNDGLTKTNTNLKNYVDAVTKDLKELQNQVDGNITTWFYNGVPTLENQPANEWLTDEEKINHLGDLYYDQNTGYAYRWALINNQYEWTKIVDADVVEALAIANSAKDTADQKRRTFFDEPITPYDSGDIWIYNGEIYRCIRSRAEGEWNTADWVNDLIYTDDTTANKAITDLNQFKQDVKNEYVTNKVLEETEKSISSTIQSVQIQVDKKNTVFKEEPTTPYIVGDVWIQNEKVYVCINAREEGDFNKSDWELNLDNTQYATKTQVEQTDKNVSILAEDVKKIETDTTASKQTSGNPIIIEDAGPYPLKSVEIEGKSVQDGTPIPDEPVEIKTVKGVRNILNITEENHTTYYDITEPTFVYNKTGYTVISKSWAGDSFYFPTVIGQEYTLQYETDGNFTNIRILNKDNATMFLNCKIEKGKHIYTFTAEDTGYYFRTWTYQTTATLNYAMIEEGPIAHDSVPFGTWLLQKTIGRNRLKLEDANNTWSGITVNRKGTKFLYNGTLSATSALQQNYVRVDKTFDKPTGLVIAREGSISGTLAFNIEYVRDGVTKYQAVTSFVFQPGDTLKQIYNIFYVGVSFDNYEVTILLTEDINNPEWEEHKENTASIDMNKPNFWNIDNWEPFTDLTKYGNNGFTLLNSSNRVLALNLDEELLAGQYTIKFDVDNSNLSEASKLGFEALTATSVSLSRKVDNEKHEITFNTTDSIGILYFYINSSESSEATISLDNIKLYKGVDPYYEFASTKDTKDVFKDGVLTQRIGKIVLDGSEDWQIGSGNYFINGTNYKTLSEGGTCINTHYSNPTGTDKSIWIGNSSFIVIKDSSFTTLSELKSGLSENPVTVYYILAEPIKHQLNYEALQMHQSYNYITLNDDLLPNMNVEYLTDSKMNAEYATKAELEVESSKIKGSVKAEIDDLDKSVEASLELKVDREKLASEINAIANLIKLISNDLIIQTDKFQLLNGVINAVGGTIGNIEIGDNYLSIPIKIDVDITQSDLDKAFAYIRNVGTLTDEELIKYDLNKDGEVTVADCAYMSQIIKSGITTKTPGYIKIISDGLFSEIVIIDGNGSEIVNIGLDGISAINLPSKTDVYYEVGDLFEINKFTAFSGYLTGSKKHIVFALTLPKSMSSDITGATINALNIYVRHPDGGYLLGNATLDDFDGTISVTKSMDNMLLVEMSANTEFNFTNNVPLSVSISVLNLTFT